MPLDGRADLYALGCVAWWLLTGREVFARELGEEVLLRRHLGVDVPSLRAACTGWIPAELEMIVTALLAKDPDDRPGDARALAAQLRAIAIPAEHAWTEADAEAWWRTNRAPVRVPGAAVMPQEAATRILVSADR